jgi:hypothetical protein
VAFAAKAAASSVALARRLGLDTEKVVEALAGSPLVSAWQAAGRAMLAFERRDMLDETANRSLLPLRKAIIEPAFSQIKFNRGFARFGRRGLSAARSEWKLICMTHNLLKYWRTKAAAPAMA